jgi:signal transduction histidine kinase
MESVDEGVGAVNYGKVLAEYLRERSEQALLRATDLSRAFVEAGLGPEDVVALHFESLEIALRGFSYRQQAQAIGDAHHFLLETMITYGVSYKEYLELKLNQSIADAEQRALRERERVLEAERSRQEALDVLGRIAHELRGPLTTAKGNIELASRSLSSGRVDSAAQFVETTREAIDRLSRLTADLVEASRGRPPSLSFTTIELDAVVSQACSWARVAAANKSIALALHGADQSVRLVGNADALLSVFGNILSNAIRYTPSGGRVAVRISFDDKSARVEVADTGPGMSADVKAKIFERFYRAPAARVMDSHGLGLGLSLVEQMVAAHRGTVEVESELGRGSLFRVILPRGRSAESPS